MRQRFCSGQELSHSLKQILIDPNDICQEKYEHAAYFGYFNPPLEIWNGKRYLLDIWKKNVKEFIEILDIWPVFRELRSNVELFFNVAKNCVRLNKVHQFTRESVLKKVIRALHLTFEVIKTSKCYNIGIRELAQM